MADILKPRDGKDVEAVAQWARGERKTLEIVGHGSKRGIGRAAQWDLSLDLSDLSVKVLPRAETEETVLVLGLDDARAARAMSAAMGSSNDVSGAAHFPARLAARIQAEAGQAITVVRLEGVAPSVAHRRRALDA